LSYMASPSCCSGGRSCFSTHNPGHLVLQACCCNPVAAAPGTIYLWLKDIAGAGLCPAGARMSGHMELQFLKG
jgi:hypothetical protein